MKKTGFLLFVLWFLSVPALAGDVIVKLQVLQPSLVLGEPLSVAITVENTSQSALDLPFEPILAGMNPAVLVGTPGGQALTSSHGAPLACEEAHTNITASFPWKMGKDFDITVPAGKSVEFHSRLWLPISLRTKPGIYTLTPHYVARGTHPGQLGAVIGGPAPHPTRQVGQGCWKGTVDGTAVQINFKAPTGMDAQAYQAFKGHPLKHPAELLKRFPTSTYAGYALRARIPALAREALTDLNNPDGTLRRWSDRGGSEATIQGHITKVQSAMRTYAEAAGVFLRAHPDFAYASEIRRGYAMCLGLTGHMPEAMAELQTLGEATGREAEEAKAYLGEAPKKKPQKETPQAP